MKTIKTISPIIPYIAVFTGMYIFKNAWIAIGTYHLGMALILISSGEIIPSRINFPKQKNRAYKPKSISLIFLYLFYSLTGIALYFSLPFFDQTASLKNKLQMFGLTQANWMFFALYFCVANSVLEDCSGEVIMNQILLHCRISNTPYPISQKISFLPDIMFLF